ncbi:MAG: tetratricopeptide repeat protein [Verrucomicrobiota bacterium]
MGKFTYFSLPLLSCIALYCLIGTSTAQRPNAADVYLNAFLIMQDGEVLEKKGDYAGAYDKYAEANDIFSSVARNYPTWNPQIVRMRRKKIRESLKRTAEFAGTGIQVQNRRPNAQLKPNGAGRPPNRPAAGTNVQQQFQFLRQRINELNNEREELFDNLGEKESQLRQARADLAKAGQTELLLRDALSQSTRNLEQYKSDAEKTAGLTLQVESLKKQLTLATDSLKRANESTAQVLQDLEEANKTIASLKREQEELTREKEQMASLINGLEASEDTKLLVTENMRLLEQLNAARSRIEEMSGEKQASDNEILSLREEVSQVRTELARLQQENEDYQKQIEDLRGKLENNLENQVIADPAALDSDVVAENAILKTIIQKQLRAQTRRQMAKDMLLKEFAKLEVSSDELMQQVSAIAVDAGLSNEERRFLGQAELPEAPPEEAPATLGSNDSAGDTITRYAKAAHYDFSRGKFEAAEVAYRKILEYAPHHVRTLCNLGLVQLRLNRLVEAQTIFDKALVYNPEHSFSHFLKGASLFESRKVEESLGSIAESVRLDPQNADYRYFYGFACEANGMRERAEKAFQEAITLRPDFGDAHYNLAVMYLKRPTPAIDLARKHYQLAIRNGSKPDPAIERRVGLPQIDGAVTVINS